MRRSVLFVAIVALFATAFAGPASAAVRPPTPDVDSFGGYNSVHLSWSVPAASAGIAAFEIRRIDTRVGGVTPTYGTLVARLGASARTYVDAGLTFPVETDGGSEYWRHNVFAIGTDGIFSQAGQAGTFPTSAVAGRITDSRGVGLGGVHVSVDNREWQGDHFAVSDADGSYLFDGSGLFEGTVCFRPDAQTTPVRPAGYLPECYDDVPWWGGVTVPSDRIPLTSGAVTRGVDAVLGDGAGMVGVVRTAAGVPVRNAVVTASSQDQHEYVRLVSDAQGRFSAARIHPGRYDVCANGDTTDVRPVSPVGYLRSCRGQKPGARGAFNVAFIAGKTSTTDIVLAAAGAISGRVLDPSGAPVVEGDVSIGGGYPVSTDAHGQFATTGLAPGTYRVCYLGRRSALRPDGSVAPGLLPQCWGQTPDVPSAPVTVSVGQTSKGVYLRPALTPTTSGRITGPDGSPLTGVVVTADYSQAGITDTDGRYRIGVAPGRHNLCFQTLTARGPAETGYAGSCWDGKREGESAPIEIGSSGRQNVDAVLAALPGYRIRVVDSTGKPFVGAGVFDETGSSGTTGADGVVQTRSDYWPEPTIRVSVALQDPSAAAPYGYTTVDLTVPLQPGTYVDRQVVLRAAGAITGRVTYPDGRPVAYRTVTLTGPGGEGWEPQTDEAGQFVIRSVAAGTWTACTRGNAPDGSVVRACWKGVVGDGPATPIVVAPGRKASGIAITLPAS